MIEILPLSEKRWNHCKSVADYAMTLAKQWQTDPMKAYLAGLLHDTAREMPKECFLPLAEKYKIPIGKEEREAPILLHGAISAVIAQENYGITDKEIQSAMIKHTVGDASMSTLDKIIFIADEIEPLRSFKGVEALRALAFSDLNKAVLEGIGQSEQYLWERGIGLHPKTKQMKENLLKELNNV